MRKRCTTNSTYRSMPRMRGAETVHHAPKCARFHGRSSSFPSGVMTRPTSSTAAPSGTKRHQAAPSGTKRHQAAPSGIESTAALALALVPAVRVVLCGLRSWAGALQGGGAPRASGLGGVAAVRCCSSAVGWVAPRGAHAGCGRVWRGMAGWTHCPGRPSTRGG